MNNAELKKSIAEYARTISATPGKSAVAELIIRTLEPRRLTLDIFNSFMPTTQLNKGDEIMYKVRKGRFPVATMVPGTMHLAHQVHRQDKIARAFDRIITGATCSTWELESGEVGTVESLRSDLKGDLVETLVSRVFGLLSTVWNSTDTPSNYFDASSGGITATVLDDAIENVLERAGSVRAIVGARRALFPIYEFATSVPVTVVAGQSGTAIPTDRFNEFYNTNALSMYKGIPMVELNQVFTDRLPDVNEKLIPTDKVLVIGDNAGEIALMGPTEYQDFTDGRKQPAEYQIHAWQAYSLIVDAIDKIAVIKTDT